MHVNADFSKRVVIRPGDIGWTPSPMAGVDRKMLDRICDEVARATSIVRYAPQSYFSAHEHGGGEEFFVLDGIFSDEHADYPVGTYVRNPIGTRHTPHSEKGCTIFVKLHQFDPSDQEQKVINTQTATFTPGPEPGTSVLMLHEFGDEKAALIRLEPGTTINHHAHHGGEEILVLDGILHDDQGHYPKDSWIRQPHRSAHAPYSEKGCLIYIKTGHLPSATR